MSALPLINVTGLTGAFPAATAPQVDYTSQATNGVNIDYLFKVSDGAAAPGDGVVEFSFDGIVVHGRLERFSNLQTVTRRCRHSRVWFRSVAGTTPTVIVQADGN